jgi:hypothetical protein
VGDFWSWAYSDVLVNTIRPLLAEFLVAAALDQLHELRLEWDAVDVRYRGAGVEVKSAAYLQSWAQEKLSTIRFDIAKKRAWDAKTDVYSPEPIRSADCYVFCLYQEKDPAKVDVLDATAWQFYVLSTAQIERELGDQKTLGLRRLGEMCAPVHYDELRARVDAVLVKGR